MNVHKYDYDPDTSYGRSVAPRPQPADNATTAEDLIENRLVIAFENLIRFEKLVKRQPTNIAAIDNTRRLERNLVAMNVLLPCLEVELIRLVEKYNAPHVDAFARAHRDRMEHAGNYWDALDIELLECAILPDRLAQEMRAVLAQED